MGTYNPIRAVPMAETCHNAVLRAYPGEDGSVFVRRGGAGKDADLLTLTGMAERLNRGNHEGCDRPGVWLSTLAASLSQGLQNGAAFIAANAAPELLEARGVLDRSQRRHADEAEATEAVLTLLGYLSDAEQVEHHQRRRRLRRVHLPVLHAVPGGTQ